MGVDRSSSSNTDNQKKNFSVLGEGPTDIINVSTGAAEKNSINFSQANTDFCLGLRYNGDESYLYVNKCMYISLYNCCSWSASKDFTKDE